MNIARGYCDVRVPQTSLSELELRLEPGFGSRKLQYAYKNKMGMPRDSARNRHLKGYTNMFLDRSGPVWLGIKYKADQAPDLSKRNISGLENVCHPAGPGPIYPAGKLNCLNG